MLIGKLLHSYTLDVIYIDVNSIPVEWDIYTILLRSGIDIVLDLITKLPRANMSLITVPNLRVNPE